VFHFKVPWNSRAKVPLHHHHNNAQQQQQNQRHQQQQQQQHDRNCCSCNSVNSNHHYNSRVATEEPPPQQIMSDGTDYYICECTSCRNLGNSVDVCCQCCACVDAAAASAAVAATGGSRRYHVASMTLTGDSEDTLEVCLNDYDMADDEMEMAAAAHAGTAHASESCQNCEELRSGPPPLPSCCSEGKQPSFDGWSGEDGGRGYDDGRVAVASASSGPRHYHPRMCGCKTGTERQPS
jgi:hypothetical protein